jgi:hypothetical protein
MLGSKETCGLNTYGITIFIAIVRGNNRMEHIKGMDVYNIHQGIIFSGPAPEEEKQPIFSGAGTG